MTGEPGREKRVIAISSALSTSGTLWMSAGSVSQPYRRFWNSAQAAASSSARCGGR